MRPLAQIALLAFVSQFCVAQRVGSAGPHFSGHFGHNGAPGFHSRYSPYLSPYGLYADPFFTDAFYNAGYPVSSTPPVIVMQPPLSAPERTTAPSQPPADPLMIELQGDRYVRVGVNNDSTAQTVALARSAPSATDHPAEPVLEPVTLIFRDGHRELVTDYTIADGILYSQGDYYTSGSWNKKIQLSTLDIPQTISANTARGVSFCLPNAPNQVITRP